MEVIVAEPDSRWELGRGSAAVCIPVAAAPDLLYQCLRSVVAHTGTEVPVLVATEADADPAIDRFLSTLDRELGRVRLPDSPGAVALANAVLAACGKADAVLLSSHAVVFEGWLERMRAAGRSDTTIATASALANNAGLVSVPGPYEPLPSGVVLERLAADVAARSPRVWPRIPTADGHCVWISRAALEFAGPLDTDLDSLRAALIDFSQRCLQHGLVNVVADDVFVASVMPGLSAHGGILSVGEDRPLLERRYPYLRSVEESGPPSPLARSLSVARQALGSMSVTVDARILRGSFSGAQSETLELIEILAGAEGVELRVLLDPAVGADALAELERMPGVRRLLATEVAEAEESLERTDIVHRPYQVSSPADLQLLAELGERLVITHLDLIAFHNPGYFGSFEGWRQYRRVTREALAMADRVIFLSEHAAADAIREQLVAPERIKVMPMAVDLEPAPPRRAQPPSGAPESPFLLCIGNDFRHKNRLFAVKLLEELHARGWAGQLVLAGARVEEGSSRGDEAAYLAPRAELAAAVLDLPSVGEMERAWLYANATAVVYPTTYEGFGLIPFEAARAGTPCLFAAQASLAEILPAEGALIVPWDASASAERVLPLLRDEEARRRQVDLVLAAASRMRRPEGMATDLLDVYREAACSPFRAASALAAQARDRELELARWVGLEENMGELVGPDAYLPPDVQRAVLAMATRKRLRWLLFAILRGLYRIAYRARRIRRA